jgi:hypothetical protein
MSRKYVAIGEWSGREVTAHIVDLHTFITSEPSACIVVYCEELFNTTAYTVYKSDVSWLYITEV